MSVLEVSALALATCWLAVLTVVTLVVLREVAILRFRLSQSGVVPGPQHEGLAIGSPIPAQVLTAIPETAVGAVYLLLASAICAPCRELVPRLREVRIDEPIVALLAGRADVANELAAMFPPTIRLIRDPEATVLAESLHLKTTPYALELEFGQITGKAYLHEVSDLVSLVRARQTGRRRLVRRPEVITNVT